MIYLERPTEQSISWSLPQEMGDILCMRLCDNSTAVVMSIAMLWMPLPAQYRVPNQTIIDETKLILAGETCRGLIWLYPLRVYPSSRS